MYVGHGDGRKGRSSEKRARCGRKRNEGWPAAATPQDLLRRELAAGECAEQNEHDDHDQDDQKNAHEMLPPA
jgi:hypothetical protein